MSFIEKSRRRRQHYQDLEISKKQRTKDEYIESQQKKDQINANWTKEYKDRSKKLIAIAEKEFRQILNLLNQEVFNGEASINIEVYPGLEKKREEISGISPIDVNAPLHIKDMKVCMSMQGDPKKHRDYDYDGGGSSEWVAYRSFFLSISEKEEIGFTFKDNNFNSSFVEYNSYIIFGIVRDHVLKCSGGFKDLKSRLGGATLIDKQWRKKIEQILIEVLARFD